MASPLAAFIGSWRMESGFSETVIQISEQDGKPHVACTDGYDGEKLEVTDVAFDGISLDFSLKVPSNNHRTRSRIKMNSDGTLEEEITLLQKLVRA